MMSNAIGRRQRSYEAKRMINSQETFAEYIVDRRQVKRIVKQEKREKELSIARICEQNPKSFYSNINGRRIVSDKIGQLKTLDGTVFTTDSGMANTMKNYLARCSPLNN